MNGLFLLLLFGTAMLCIPLFFRLYRNATALQRRQMVFAAVAAFVLAGGMLCFLSFR